MKIIIVRIGFLFIAAVLAFFSIPASAQTLTLNDGSILRSNPHRMGVNIGAIDYWDNGQVLKNLIGSTNPGFEPLLDQQIWSLAVAGSTTTFTVPDQWDGVPTNYWAGGTFQVVESQSGGAELGCSGTIASNTGPNYPVSTAPWIDPTITVSSPCAGAFNVGDIVIVSKSVFPTPEAWWESGGLGGMSGGVSGGGQLLSDTTDLCPTCGSQALNMNATAAGSSASASWYFDSASSDNLFVLLNGTYQLTFWAKTATGTPVLTASASRTSAGGMNCGQYTPALTSTWTEYTWNCTATETASGTTPGTAMVAINVSGGSVYLDNVSFQKIGTDPNNTSVFRDEVIQTLQNYYGPSIGSDPGTFRYWVNQNGESIENWTQPDYAHQPTSSGTGYFVGPGGSGAENLSLEDYLVICQLLNAEPYLEVPVTLSTTDAGNLIEFLAGESGTTYGNRRIALGQTDPWTSVFNKIHLSFCNECWNGSSFDGQSLPDRTTQPNGEYYYDYSVRARDIFAGMRANSSYSASSFDLTMNAQTAVNYTMDTAIARAHPDSIEIEDYTYGIVSSFATDAALWGPALFEPYEKVTNPADPKNFYQSVHDYQSQTTCGASGTAQCNVNIYEWGQGTISGGIDQTHMNYINAGAGEGAVMALQPLLNIQYYGIDHQNFFSLTEFKNGASGGLTAKLWGNEVDMGGATNNVRPTFLGVQVANQSIIGPMYSCPITNNLTYSFAGSPNGPNGPLPATSSVPYLYAFCFQNGNQRSLVLINTDLANSHTITFAGTNPPQGSVTQRQLAPATLDQMNEAPTGTVTNLTPATTSIESSNLSSPGSVTLPPYSVTALDYTTNGLPLAAMPTFSPGTGTYPTTQTVSISDSTTGAAIYYTTDGSTPTSSSTLYSSSITVSASETLQAIAIESGYANSSVASDSYTISSALSTPIFSPAGGSYSSAQTVTISDATPGTTIYYTTNGTTPTTSSTKYSGPITVSTSETLEAIAVESGYTNSTVASAVYAISSTLPSPTFSVPAGIYTSSQSVTISDGTAGATIYYTTNGSTPTTSSTKYSGAVTVSASETLEAIAVETGYTNSTVASAVYTISSTLPSPTFSVPAGTYTSSQSVTISDGTAGATIYFTTNGSTPTTSSTKYSGAISVSASETLEAIAVETGYSNSPVVSAAYTISSALPAPTFAPAAGTYTTSQSVTIGESASGTTIYYTTNGSTPTTSSAVYHGPFMVSATEMVKAVAAKSPAVISPAATASYTIKPLLPSPLFSLAGGTYATAQSVTITEGMAGSTIYYTTNGTTPTTSSTVYSGPITISTSETLEAIAVNSKYTPSPVASVSYTIGTILSAPTFSPSPGTYNATQSISMNEVTSGTKIYYTTNGTTPTTSSAVYSGPIAVSASETLKAMASATGFTQSAVTSATYTIHLRKSPRVKLIPSSTSISTGESLDVSIAVSGDTGDPTPTGTVTVSSVGFSSAPSALNSGNASISVPAGTLSTGSDTLTASYAPDASSSSTWTAITASVTVAVTPAVYSLAATGVTVLPGQSATSKITVSSNTGFSGAITLACAVTSSPKGAIDLPTCASSQPVALSSSSTSKTANVTVNTTGASGSALADTKPSNSRGFGGIGRGAILGLLLLFGIPARRRKLQAMLCALLFAALMGGLAGCGGVTANSTPVAAPNETSPGAYTITVTGTGNDSSKTKVTTTFTLNVN